MQAALNRRYPEEAKALEEFITPWHEEGLAQGRREGTQRVVLHLIRRRFGRLPPELVRSIRVLPVRTLVALADVLLDLKSLEELHSWLKAHETSEGPSHRD